MQQLKRTFVYTVALERGGARLSLTAFNLICGTNFPLKSGTLVPFPAWCAITVGEPEQRAHPRILGEGQGGVEIYASSPTDFCVPLNWYYSRRNDETRSRMSSQI